MKTHMIDFSFPTLLSFLFPHKPDILVEREKEEEKEDEGSL